MSDNNQNSPEGSSFNIEATIDMGMGNQQLINDLMGSESSTSNPDDVTPIVKEVEDPKPEPKPNTPKGKEIVHPDKPKEERDIIDNFLGGDDSTEDEDEDETLPAVKKSKTPDAPKDDSEDEDEDDNNESSTFSSLSKELFNLGVFEKDDDEDDVEITSPQQFLERFQNEKKKGAIQMINNFIGQFGEDYQNAFDSIFVKGVNPNEYFKTFNKITNFADLDLTVESNQEAVVRQSLIDQGFENEDVDTEIERLKSYGDLESVSQRNHKVLVKREAVKLQELEKKAQLENQQKTAIKNQYITNVNSILEEKLKQKEFDGIPINPRLATELQDFLLVDKYKTASGETLTDFDKAILEMKRPENHETKVKVALLLKIMEKDPTLSTIQKAGVSKKSQSLFADVAKQVEKSKSSNNQSSKTGEQPKRWFS
jgi:hypothetical protein